MRTNWRISTGRTVVALIVFGALANRLNAATPQAVRWEKLTLDDKYNSCGVAVGDINKDGHLDVIAGGYWYAGPDFKTRHTYYPPEKLDPAKDSSENKLSYIYDFNGAGWP